MSGSRILPARRWDLAVGLYLGHLWALFGLALSNGLLGLSLLASAADGRLRRFEWRRHAGVLLPAGLYVAAFVASVALSVDRRVSLAEAGELWAWTTLILALALLHDERRVRLAIDGLVAACGLFAVWGLAELAIRGWTLADRIRGPFSHYMTFAGVLALADLLLVARLLFGRRPAGLWRWAALVAINLALAASFTRSAWVGVAIAFTVLLLARAARFAVLYLPAALLFLLLAPAPLVDRATSTFDLRDLTNYDRLCMLDAGLHMLADRPLFGIGPGQVEELYPIYRHPSARRWQVMHLHNSMMQLAAERGLVSLAAYLWLMVGALLATAREMRRRLAVGDGGADLFAGVFAALLAFLLAGLFEDNWGDSEVQRIALFLVAVPACLSGRPADDAGSEPPLS